MLYDTEYGNTEKNIFIYFYIKQDWIGWDMVTFQELHQRQKK
jgi:hypothetical protein